MAIEPKFYLNLHPITVSLVGCGGTGSLIATRLARVDYAMRQMGMKGLSVLALDDDIIEPFNVGRQMFVPEDVGDYKSECIISKINQSFQLNWNAQMEKATTEDQICSNFVITAVDNVETRKKIHDHFYKKNQDAHIYQKKYYWIDCGNGKDFGQVVLSDHDNTLKNIFDISPNIKEQEKNVEVQGVGCSYEDKLNEQDLFINDEIAIIATEMVWRMLKDRFIDYNVVFSNKKTMERKKAFMPCDYSN